MGNWKRDSNIPYPSIWRKFQVKSKNSDEIYNFQIEDATMDMTTDIVNNMLENYWPDEPVSQCFNVINDAESLPYLDGFYNTLVSARTVLVCFKIEKDLTKKLVGCNMTMVMEPGDSFSDFEVSPLLKDYISVFIEVSESINLFEQFGISVCLEATGLAVDKNYRGLGIATEILNARTDLCKALKIPLTVTDFTSGISQAAARKAGFTLAKTLKYADIMKKLPHLPLRNISHPVIQIMYKIIELN